MSLVHRSLVSLGIMGIACVLGPTNASANYYVNSVVNNSSEPVTVSTTVQPGKAIKNRGFGWSFWGEINITGRTLGDVKIYENGSRCPGNSWAAEIEHGTQKWGFGYEGNGAIDITIAADHSVKIGGNGHVVAGGCDGSAPPPEMATLTCWYRGDFSYYGYLANGQHLRVGQVEHHEGVDNEYWYGALGTSGSDCPRRMPGH